MRETDAMLRRFERNHWIACAVMAVVATAIGRFDVAVGIVGGGLLTGLSYRAIRDGVDAMMPAGSTPAPPPSARRRLFLVAKFIGRYALLALAAYVMLIRLRLHPVGLLVGASSPVVAAAIEAVRTSRGVSPPGHSR